MERLQEETILVYELLADGHCDDNTEGANEHGGREFTRHVRSPTSVKLSPCSRRRLRTIIGLGITTLQVRVQGWVRYVLRGRGWKLARKICAGKGCFLRGICVASRQFAWNLREHFNL